MTPPVTTQDLLPSEVAFVATMQLLGFGFFEYLQICGGELVVTWRSEPPRSTMVFSS